MADGGPREQASALAAAAQPKGAADLLMGDAHQGCVSCAWCGQGVHACGQDVHACGQDVNACGQDVHAGQC